MTTMITKRITEVRPHCRRFALLAWASLAAATSTGGASAFFSSPSRHRSSFTSGPEARCGGGRCDIGLARDFLTSRSFPLPLLGGIGGRAAVTKNSKAAGFNPVAVAARGSFLGTRLASRLDGDADETKCCGRRSMLSGRRGGLTLRDTLAKNPISASVVAGLVLFLATFPVDGVRLQEELPRLLPFSTIRSHQVVMATTSRTSSDATSASLRCKPPRPLFRAPSAFATGEPTAVTNSGCSISISDDRVISKGSTDVGVGFVADVNDVDADFPPHALEESLPEPSAVGSMSSPSDATALTSNPLKLAPSLSNTPLDECWGLVKKYYIDQTFNGQDWDAVKVKYDDLVAKAQGDDSAATKYAAAMISSLGDRYSRVLDAPSYARIQKFDLIGVGATLMPDSERRITVGAPPVSGSAADRAGLRLGEFVTAVNGVPTAGRTAFDIIDQISEDPNAKTITMTILRQGDDDLPGEGTSREVTMEREFTKVKDPIFHKISEERRSDGKTRVGYIKIKEFNSLVKSRLEEALVDLEQRGANAYVLDLRGNPGGAFQSAVEISSLFVEDKVATSVVDSNQIELPFRTAKGRVVVQGDHPLAVWMDRGSASASEVLAGSLHDNCRAVIMGEQSFGKGLIQAVYGLKNGSGLVLTVARYVTPNGTDIQGSGITPNIPSKGVVPPPFVPGISSDTSKVDFEDVSRRLGPEVCRALQD